jgi:hypothetical protein
MAALEWTLFDGKAPLLGAKPSLLSTNILPVI